MSDPVELTRRFATTVDDLAEAWSVVMTYLDQVGGAPRVEISPYWIVSDDPDKNGRQRFSVVVSGMEQV